MEALYTTPATAHGGRQGHVQDASVTAHVGRDKNGFGLKAELVGTSPASREEAED